MLSGKVSLSKSKGKAYVDELNRALSPESIASATAETQKCKY